MLDKKVQEKADELFDEFAFWKTKVIRRHDNVEPIIHELPSTIDRYNNTISKGDEVDFIAAAPGGLKRGTVAFIVEMIVPKHTSKQTRWRDNGWVEIESEIQEYSAKYIYIYTKGKRWTSKYTTEVIKIPESAL